MGLSTLLQKNPFNRTTVECKSFRRGDTAFGGAAFNRTTVECKSAYEGLQIAVGEPFNRTTVECKYN